MGDEPRVVTPTQLLEIGGMAQAASLAAVIRLLHRELGLSLATMERELRAMQIDHPNDLVADLTRKILATVANSLVLSQPPAGRG